MKIKTIAAIMLILSMLASAAACAAPKKDSAADTTTTAAETEDIDPRFAIRENVPDYTFDGYKFRVHMRQGGWGNDFYAEEATGDVVVDAVYARNAVTEERFDITFDFIPSDVSPVPTILADDDAYDAVMPHGRHGFSYAMEGALVEWSSLPYINLDNPWWNQDAKTEFTVGGRLYCMLGQLSYQTLGMTFGIFFDKTLFENYSITEPYEDVRAGKWTFDKFAEIGKVGKEDLNGDGKIKPEDDQFGYITSLWHGALNIQYSQGGRLTGKDEDDLPYMVLNTEKNIDIFDKYFSFIKEAEGYIWYQQKYQDKQIFSSGRALMFEYSIDVAVEMRSSETNFGIVPPPKYDEAQDNYHSMINAAVSSVCVPITNRDLELTSIILEAWSAESYRVVMPAYYNVALQVKYARDDDSAEMLDIIVDNAVVDLLYYYGDLFGLDGIGVQLAAGNARNFSSFYASNEKTANKSIQKFINKFTEV